MTLINRRTLLVAHAAQQAQPTFDSIVRCSNASEIMSSCWECNTICVSYRPAHLLRVLEGHHGQCAKCSVGILGTGLAYDVHPIRPVSLGVKSNYLNLALLCKKCHYRISAAMSRGETDVIAKYECQGLIDLPLSDPAD